MTSRQEVEVEAKDFIRKFHFLAATIRAVLDGRDKSGDRVEFDCEGHRVGLLAKVLEEFYFEHVDELKALEKETAKARRQA